MASGAAEFFFKGIRKSPYKLELAKKYVALMKRIDEMHA